MRVTTEYGLRLRSTGQLVHIEAQDIGGYDEYARLTLDEHDPVFTVPHKEDLVDVLVYNPILENSEHRRPNWGRLNVADLQPVEIKTIVEVTQVDLPLPLMFRPIESRDVPRGVASRYAGVDLPGESRYVLVVTPLPENVTEADVRERIGQAAFFGDPYTKRHIVGVGPVPEEYEPDLDGRPGVALICQPM